MFRYSIIIGLYFHFYGDWWPIGNVIINGRTRFKYASLFPFHRPVMISEASGWTTIFTASDLPAIKPYVPWYHHPTQTTELITCCEPPVVTGEDYFGYRMWTHRRWVKIYSEGANYGLFSYNPYNSSEIF